MMGLYIEFYRCTEQTTLPLRTRRICKKLVTTLEFHASIDHQVTLPDDRVSLEFHESIDHQVTLPDDR